MSNKPSSRILEELLRTDGLPAYNVGIWVYSSFFFFQFRNQTARVSVDLSRCSIYITSL